MNITQLNYTDLQGKRFNGYDLHLKLNSLDYNSHYLVWTKRGSDKKTDVIAKFCCYHLIKKLFEKIENNLSIQQLIYPFSWLLLFKKDFRKSDLIHYHLIHNSYFSLLSLPILTKLKPTVWTLHDPWALTGHCVHPYKCDKWQTLCYECPYLGNIVPMKNDRTKFMFRVKRFIYKHSNFTIVVASNWMKRMVSSSPLMKNKIVHLIPFGINLDVFKPQSADDLKKKLNIPQNNIVIAFRANHSEFKGMEYINACLQKLNTNQKITILTFDIKGLYDTFNSKYQIVDCGWVEDAKYLAKLLNIVDIFLMPSMAETFGMMAIEVMACGKPLIIFENTALSEITHAPIGAIAVPYGDSNELTKAVHLLLKDPSKRKMIGENARKIATKHYDFKNYIKDHVDLYQSLVK